MNCRECGGELVSRTETYRYDAEGLNIPLRDIEFRKCLSCGAEDVAIPHLAAMNRTIARELILKHSLLSPKEFRFLRKYIGWSSADCAKILGYDPSTISRYENAKEDISPKADRALRVAAANGVHFEDYGTELQQALVNLDEKLGAMPLSIALRKSATPSQPWLVEAFA